MKNLTAILAVLMLIFAGLACSTDETDKANVLVDEANKFITEGNVNVKEAETKLDQFNKMVSESEDFTEGQQKINDFGNKELTPTFDKMKDNFQKAGEKFEAAAKLKVNEKYKEYLDAKAAEFKKRAEYAEALKGIPKTYAASKDETEYSEKVKAEVDKSQKILKEANDLGDKGNKIQTDNPAIFKKS